MISKIITWTGQGLITAICVAGQVRLFEIGPGWLALLLSLILAFLTIAAVLFLEAIYINLPSNRK